MYTERKKKQQKEWTEAFTMTKLQLQELIEKKLARNAVLQRKKSPAPCRLV